MKYLQVFTVESDFTFPTDMLRYDCCWPLSQRDATMIATSLANHGQAAFKVELGRWVTTRKASPPTVERWESFNCKVSNTETR